MTERFISIKSTGELPEQFKDKVSFQLADNNIEAVILKIDDQLIRIVTAGTYSNHLKLLVTQPKKAVTKYKLSGTVHGIEIVPELFNSEYVAADRKLTVEGQSYGGIDLKIEEVVDYVDEDKL